MTTPSVPNTLVNAIEPMLPSAVKTLNDYLNGDDTNRSTRDRAKIALQLVNTAITIQRAVWTQQRHMTGIARTLSDGDLDAFEQYVRSEIPQFPQVRKVAIDGTPVP